MNRSCRDCHSKFISSSSDMERRTTRRTDRKGSGWRNSDSCSSMRGNRRGDHWDSVVPESDQEKIDFTSNNQNISKPASSPYATNIWGDIDGARKHLEQGSKKKSSLSTSDISSMAKVSGVSMRRNSVDSARCAPFIHCSSSTLAIPTRRSSSSETGSSSSSSVLSSMIVQAASSAPSSKTVHPSHNKSSEAPDEEDSFDSVDPDFDFFSAVCERGLLNMKAPVFAITQKSKAIVKHRAQACELGGFDFDIFVVVDEMSSSTSPVKAFWM